MVTVYNVLNSITKYEGAPSAHSMVIADCRKYAGKTVSTSAAWCSETVGAALAAAGGSALTGGFQSSAADLKKHAPKGTWHSGASGILPGDIVLYGSNGKPNHTELAIGADLNISGNYTPSGWPNGVYRRRRSGRSIVGYIRPKYAKMPAMDDLQIRICAADVMLEVYGSKQTRVKNLSVFGAENASRIQQEVDRIAGNEKETIEELAIYTIADRAGTLKYRKKRLGSWAKKVQSRIDEIYLAREKTIEQAAMHVIEDKYHTGETRKLLLKFCGFDPQKVQDEVNRILEEEQPKRQPAEDPAGWVATKASLVSIFRDGDRSKQSIDGLQGDSFIMKAVQQDGTKKAIVMDTAKYGAKDKVFRELGDVVDAILMITHPHSDHMGQTANDMIKEKKVSHVYLPRRSTIMKDYLERYDALVKDCKTAKIPVTELRQGDRVTYGGMTVKTIFQQADADSVNMRSLCFLTQLAGATFLNLGDHHFGTKESKLDPSMIGHVTIFDTSHHGLYTGDRKEAIKAISPDWIIHSGWKSWPLGTVGQDPKTRDQQKIYQQYGNLIPGDICGRTELKIENGMVDLVIEKGARQTTIEYYQGGAKKSKTVTTCTKTTFNKVGSMIPHGAAFA